MQLWRTADGALLKTFPETVSYIAFSPDGTTLLAAGTNIVWRRVSDGALIESYEDNGSTNHYNRYIAFTPDGHTFLRARAVGEIFAARVPVALHPFTRNGPGLTLHWSGGAGTYQLQQKTNLTAPWQDIGGVITNLSAEVTNQFPSSFYRVISMP
ncbi:MAG: repeat protein [Pedosphaera sp.]|nr:repeat protein [Pedosphaera sp.]